MKKQLIDNFLLSLMGLWSVPFSTFNTPENFCLANGKSKFKIYEASLLSSAGLGAGAQERQMEKYKWDPSCLCFSNVFGSLTSSYTSTQPVHL